MRSEAQFVVVALGVAISAVGALGIASPARLLTLVRQVQTPRGLYVAAALRLVLGAALVLAAPASRWPAGVRVFGVVVIVIGLVTPAFGLARWRRLLEWWSTRSTEFVRGWACAAVAVGLLLAWVVTP